MRIEYMLLGIIVLVIIIDFLSKKNKQNKNTELKQKSTNAQSNSKSKTSILKYVLVSIFILVFGGLIVYLSILILVLIIYTDLCKQYTFV